MNNTASPLPEADPIAVLQDAAERLPQTPASLAAVVALLCVSDRLQARAVGMLASGVDHSNAGMPAEMFLRLETRRLGSEGHALTGAADVLRAMPHLAEALASGVVSWPQARAIIGEVRGAKTEVRQGVDALIGEAASGLVGAEPEVLVERVTDEIHRLRADLLERREERRITHSFLALQARLDGSGGSIFGEADAERFATITTALDALAERPVNPETHPDAPTRAQQRMDALVGLCEGYLTGDMPSDEKKPTRARPRPRMLLTVDLANLADPTIGQHARILWGAAGRPARISRLTAETLACDAEVVPIIFKDGHPIGVGDTRKTIPEKVRTALEARDGGCRFPGCRAPVSWTDGHHLIPREPANRADRRRAKRGDNRITNLGLFCRRCHRRIHAKDWKVTLLPAGVMKFTRRGKTYVTYPRGSPPQPG